jgi:hypothetical protein
LSRAVLVSSFHSFPLLAGVDRRGIVGKLFAVDRRALERAGGFEALTTRLGEDVALADRLRRDGGTIAMAPIVATAAPLGRSVGETLARFTRWTAVVRSERPWLLVSYPLFVAAAPLAITIAVIGIVRGDPATAWAGFAALAVRVALACAARRFAGLTLAPHSALCASVAADSALLASWSRALLSRRLVWRGKELALGSSGALARRGQQCEEPLRDAREETGAPIMEDDGVLLLAGKHPVDPRELVLDAFALLSDPGGDLASRLLAIDAKSADQSEERQAPEIGRIHHRKALRAEDDVREVERHERVPEGRMVGDDEHRRGRERGAKLGEAADDDPAERLAEARAGVACEPAPKERVIARGDHGGAS